MTRSAPLRKATSDSAVRKTGDILMRALVSAKVSESPCDKSDENLQRRAAAAVGSH
jgi:hypothetical protein